MARYITLKSSSSNENNPFAIFKKFFDDGRSSFIIIAHVDIHDIIK